MPLLSPARRSGIRVAGLYRVGSPAVIGFDARVVVHTQASARFLQLAGWATT